MKLLIIRLSSLGDIVLTQPVVKALSDHYQDCEIFYLTKPHFSDIVKSFPEKVNILYWRNDPASLTQLLKYKFDIVIDLHNKPNTALIRLFARSKKKVVYNKQRKLREQIVRKTTTKSIRSTLELYSSALDKLNLPFHKTYPVLMANSSDVHKKYDLLENEYIMIFPGATSFTKRWLPQYFTELTDSLKDQKIVIAGSSSEMESAQYIVNNSKSDIVNLTGKTSIEELISLISSAKAVIANDSGPAHIAAALRKPQITIFGATSPKLGFAPLNENGIIITKNLPCSPCSLHGSDSCPLGHFDCMTQIKPDDVLIKLHEMICKSD